MRDIKGKIIGLGEVIEIYRCNKYIFGFSDVLFFKMVFRLFVN